MSNFIQLKALAKNTVGSSCDYLIDLMLILLELYDQFNSKVDHLDNQIKECIRGIDPPCLSLPGIGELSAAILLSESGDFSKLQTPQKCSPLPVWSLDTSSQDNLSLQAIGLNTALIR